MNKKSFSTSFTSNLQEVTKNNPCPICEKPDWCHRFKDTGDNLIGCQRPHLATEKAHRYYEETDRCFKEESEYKPYWGLKSSQEEYREQNKRQYKKSSSPDHEYLYPVYERTTNEEEGIETELGLLVRSNKTLKVVRWDKPKDIKQWTVQGNKTIYRKDIANDSIIGLYSNCNFDLCVERGKLPIICNAVIFVEGEKNVDVFNRLDDNLKRYFAVTNPGGASKITKEQIKLLLPALKKSNVPIILSPDNDKPGFDHVRLIHKLLCDEGLQDRIRIVDFSKALNETFVSVPPKFDMADYVDRFGWVFQTVDDFINYLTVTDEEFPWDTHKEETKEAQKGKYKFESWEESFNSLGAEIETEWLVERLLLKGSSTVLTAKPKVGKTVLTLDLLASVFTEKTFLGRTTKQAKVLYLNNDQPKKGFLLQVQNRWKNVGNGLIVCNGWKADNEGISQLEEWAEANKGSLIVLDSIRACICQPLNISQNDESTGYKMKEIIDRISPYECSIIFIHHDSKNRENTGTHKSSGHTSITSMVDNIWHLNMDANGNRKLSVLGTRLGDECQIAYYLDDSYQCQVTSVDSDNEDLMNESEKGLSLEQTITKYLETQGKNYSTAKEIAEAIVKSQQSVKRVLHKMGLDSRKVGQATCYRLNQ